jgi:hypothetical protein
MSEVRARRVLLGALFCPETLAILSEVRITETKRGKTTRLRLDDSGELQFVPDKKGSGDKKVVLKMGIDDQPPPKLEGTYTAHGKTVTFTLVRK